MGVFNKILFGLVAAYIVNSIHTFYQIFYYENCNDEKYCINPVIKRDNGDAWPPVQLRVYLGAEKRYQKDDITLVYQQKNFDLNTNFEDTIQYEIPPILKNNGSLRAYVVLVESDFEVEDLKKANWQSSDAEILSRYDLPKDKTFSLVVEEKTEKEKKTAIPHMSSVIPISFVLDDVIFDERRIPDETSNRISIIRKNGRKSYAPIIIIDNMRIRMSDEVEIDSEIRSANLSINYKPISWGRYRLGLHMEMSFRQLKDMGFGDKDFDDMKAIFNEMNFPFLVMMVSVAAVHLLFDFLTFKNDVQFWQQRKTMVGISTKTLLWRCVSETLIFFYLTDEKSSYLVLIPSGIGTIVEYWKLRRALKMELYLKKGWIPWLRFGKLNKEEEKTEALDSEGMRYLIFLLIPLCVIGAIYNLLYVPQKSWYSWLIKCLANCIYAFGFLFMLPQLFLNYKLKSVAHLPWRAFMYKAFNTFIDDVFAFIITMPTAHRLACFRDDLVFVIFLYQRYLYPVDKSRVNEFGESFEDDKKKEE